MIFAALVAVLSIFLFNLKPVIKGLGVMVFSVYGLFSRPAVSYTCAFVLAAAAVILLLKRIFINYDLKPWFSPVSRYVTVFLEKCKSGRIPVIAALLVIFLFFAPYIFKGEDTHVKIFDVLDAWVPQVKVLVESGKTFDLNPEAKVDNIINGLRLSGFNSGYNFSAWFFMIFKPFTAYTLNLLMMALTAFWGMVLLLKRFVTGSDGYPWIVIGTALCFSLITFYPPSGLSISGFPLLLYLFLSVKNGEGKTWYLLVFFLFPFYSLLHHAGIFIIFTLGVIFLVDIFKNKRFNMLYFWGLAVLSVSYVFTHFHLIYAFFDPGFVSHREEIVVVPMSTVECLKDSLNNFLFDRTNVVSGQRAFVLLAAAWAFLIALFKRSGREFNRLMLFMVLVLGNALLWGFKYWEGIAGLREDFGFLNAFNFARFFWLNPPLWYIIFALSLLIISKIKYGKRIVTILIVCQVLFLFASYNIEYRHLSGQKNGLHSSLTYRQFYSEDLFRQIDEFIGKPKKAYRIASLGIHPAVAQYNGFYTLDVYCTLYPLSYKHKFRRILEKELEKNKDVKRVFDDNGKRLYLLSAELHNNKWRSLTFARGITKKQQHLKVRKLELNTAAFREMGGEYIFSAVEIVNYAENGFSFEGTFEDNVSPWRIYLYKVIPVVNGNDE